MLKMQDKGPAAIINIKAYTFSCQGLSTNLCTTNRSYIGSNSHFAQLNSIPNILHMWIQNLCGSWEYSNIIWKKISTNYACHMDYAITIYWEPTKYNRIFFPFQFTTVIFDKGVHNLIINERNKLLEHQPRLQLYNNSIDASFL